MNQGAVLKLAIASTTCKLEDNGLIFNCFKYLTTLAHIWFFQEGEEEDSDAEGDESWGPGEVNSEDDASDESDSDEDYDSDDPSGKLRLKVERFNPNLVRSNDVPICHADHQRHIWTCFQLIF